MRQIFVILALLGTYFLMEFLQTESLSGVEHFTLAAIGLVILSAFTTAELGTRTLKLPQVTGFIVAGILLGPNISNILSKSVVQELKMFNTLALGLIALNAGLELSIGSIRQIGKTLTYTIVLKLFFLLVLVGGSFYAVGMLKPEWIDPSLSQGALAGFALIFAALAIGTSPAIVIAVSTELKAKGRLHDLVLGAAVFKDLVVVVTLAFVLVLARPMIDGSGAFELKALTPVLIELGGSIVVGAGLGFLTMAYIRFVGFEMLLFIFCLILFAAEMASALHLELLLVFISAGFVVRNFSHYEEEVLHPLTMVSLPTYIVFFTIAGAAIDLDRTVTLFPAALILVIARGVAYYLAAHGAGFLAGEPFKARTRAALAYLPQAGVTLGLVGLAAQQLSQHAEILLDLGVTCVAINLLIGPLGLRKALVGEASVSTDTPKEATPKVVASFADEQIERSDLKQIQDPKIRDLVDQYFSHVTSLLHQTFLFALDGAKSHTEYSLKGTVGEETSAFRRAEKIIEWTRMGVEPLFIDKRVVFNRFWEGLAQASGSLPSLVLIPVQKEDAQKSPKDSLVIKARKFLLRFRLQFNKKFPVYRKLPLKNLVRLHLEGQLVQFSVETLKTHLFLETKIFAKAKQDIEEGVETDEIIQDLLQVMNSFVTQVELDFEKSMAIGLSHFVKAFTQVGTPALPSAQVRLTELELAHSKLLGVAHDLLQWGGDFKEAAVSDIKLTAIRHQVSLKFEHMVKGTLTPQIIQITAHYQSLFAKALQTLGEVEKEIKDLEFNRITLERLRSDLLKIIEKPDLQAIERQTHRFNVETSSHRVAILFRRLAASGAGQFLTFAHDNEEALTLAPLERFHTTELNLSEVLDDCIIGDFSYELDSTITQFKEHLNNFLDLNGRINQTLLLALDSSEEDEHQDLREALTEAIRLSEQSLKSYQEELQRVSDDSVVEIQTAYERTSERIQKAGRERSLKKDAIQRIYQVQNALDQVIQKYRHVAIVHHSAKGAYFLTKKIARLRQFHLRQLRVWLSSLISPKKNPEFHLAQFVDHLDLAPVFAKATPLFRKGFSMEPLRDKKFFAANEQLLKDLLAAEKAWNHEQKGGSQLIVGEPGSGRTSLLNLAQLELSAERILRIDHVIGEWRGQLFHRLARELGCDHTESSLKERLNADNQVVIIDDLAYWFAPGVSGLKQIRKFLNIATATAAQTFWLVTMNKNFFDAYDNHIGLSQGFSNVHQIRSISPQILRQVIFNRLSYCGVNVEFQNRFDHIWGRWFQWNTEQELYFRDLNRQAKGNLRDALRLWVRSLEFSQEKQVAPSLDTVSINRDLFYQAIPKGLLAPLVVLDRHGPMSATDLSHILSMPYTEVRQVLAQLGNLGQVRSHGKKSRHYDITRRVKSLVAQVLKEHC